MRVLLLALVAALALAGVAAAAPGGSSGGGGRGILSGFRAGRKSRGLLQLDQPGGIDVTSLTSGASTISLTVQQRKDPNAQVSLKYYLVSYNNNTKAWLASATEVPSSWVTATTQADTPSADFNTYQVTLTGVAAGYYRVRVAVVRDTDEFPRTFPATDGVAVGTPGDVAINGAAPVTGDRLQVTFTISSPVTAGKYRYQVYQFGSTRNTAQASAFVDITPWTTATHTFTTPTATPLSSGLYSVWVEVQHKDDATLSKTTTTGATTSYAIGTPEKPSIARVDEPSSVSQKFTVYFVLPNNVQEMGYTLTNLKDNSDATPTATCQLIGGSKCKAAFTPVTNDPNGATHSLETDSAPANALYQIKLWAFNDVDRSSGTASDPSKPVATYDTPGAPAEPTASETSANSKVLRVTFSRAATAIASSYRYDVVDAAGDFAKYGSNVDMQNLVATIADVNQLNLQFDTLAITSVNKRYKVVLRACTSKDCSAGTDSNLAAVGPPTAPQSVGIASAGVDKLTVTWAAPATDTATSYTVRLYRSADAFAGSHVAEWAGISWILQPEQTAYSYTTPKLDAAPYSLSLGYYKAEVLAVSQLYPANPPKENSNSDEAALGIPGPITVKTVVQEPLANQVRITFSEAQPKTAEWYALTVQKWNQVTSSWESQPGLIKVARSATARGDGDKDIIQSTTASEWTGAGKYQFIVSAGNEAGGANEYPRDSAPAQLLVGPPGRPTATAPDTTGMQLDITIAQGTPTLDEDYQVRIFKFAANAWPLTCPTAGWIEETDPSKALTATTSTLTDAKAIYCIRAVALFGENGEIYGQSTAPSPIYVGTPDNPNTPTLTNGKTSLSVSFNCPTGVWNSRFMTYELKRVDMGRSDVVVNGDKANSPKLVRGTASTGEIGINENAGVCSFSIPSTGTNAVPDVEGAASNVGKYKIRLQAHNNAASSDFSVESVVEATLGEPDSPANIRVTNSATTDTKITIEMDKPNADVHGGFVLRLKWKGSGKEDDVTSTTSADGKNLYIDRNDATNVNTPSDDKWRVSFPIANMLCDGATCNGKGRFQVLAFGALSRFKTDGTAAATYKEGAEKLAAIVPTDDIFYGNPDTPTGLTIVNRRIYDPSPTNKLKLQIAHPVADVASGYAYTLTYFKVQGYSTDAVDVSDTVARDVAVAKQVGGQNVLELPINLAALQCSGKPCGAGSYQLKSFVPVSRVTAAAFSASSVAAADITTLAGGGDIIVGATDKTLQAARNVYIPNLARAATEADTVIQLEVDAADPDFLMGWSYQLQYVPGSTGTPTDVQDASSSTTFYMSRLSASVIDSGTRLRIPLKKLGDLRCNPGTGTYTANSCDIGGKFQLKALTAHSWFDTNGNAVLETNYASAVSASGFTVKSVKFGSPVADTDAAWDKVFYVGAAAAPGGIRVPDVQLAASDLKIYVTAPVADLAYSYTFTLERLKADGTKETLGNLVVYHKNSAGQDTRQLQQARKEFELTIPSSSLGGAGRFQLTDAKANSWPTISTTPESATLDSNFPIYFIYGSPSESIISVVEAPNIQTGTTVNVAIAAPVADVARFYTVDVLYYSGTASTPPTNPLTTASAPVVDVVSTADCSTTGKQALSTVGQTARAGTVLVVQCPANCAGSTAVVHSSAPNAYLYTSSICRAAIHAGVGGTDPVVQLTLQAGTALRSWTQDAENAGANGVDLVAPATEVQAADNWDMVLAGSTGLTTTTTFTVPRAAATVDGTKLKLPIDLSKANCRTGGTAEQNKCSNGKYLVTSVKAHPWSGTGTKEDTTFKKFSFVGDPETPTGVVGVSTTAAENTLSIRFTRTDIDTATAYYVEATEYFPGSTEKSPKCTGTINMPDDSDDVTSQFYTDVDATTRQIKLSCTSFNPAKYKVTTFKAVSAFTTPTDDFDKAATPSTAYFYSGTVGAIEDGSVKVDNSAPSPSTLAVEWRQTSPDAAKSASYKLYRWLTGATAKGNNLCTTDGTADLTTAFDYATPGTSTTPLRKASVPLCAGAGTSLGKGRYKIEWTVVGGAAASDSVMKESQFFYIGNPEAPTNAPSVANDAANSKLIITFDTPANDNAAGYKYDLVKLANPSVTVPALTNSGGTLATDGFTFVATKSDVTTGLGATTNTFEHTLTDARALYIVRIWSWNGNDETGVATGWSAVIGTGTTPAKPSIISVQDGLDRLTVKFSLMANAIKYKYTVYTEGVSTSALTGHTSKPLATSDITWIGSTEGQFVIGPDATNLVAGRYKVAVAAINTDGNGNDQTDGESVLSSMAAVGMPSKPNKPTLAVPKDASNNLIRRALEITFAEPTVDSGLEYYYALYREDTGTGGACYTTVGVKVDTATNSEGFTVVLPDGALTADPTGTTRKFRLTDITALYDYKIRVGVKNGLVVSKDSTATVAASQKEGGLTGITVCGGAATALDSTVRWSDLSDGTTSAIDDPDAPSDVTAVYNHGTNNLAVTFKAPATARTYTYKVVDLTRSNNAQVPMTAAAAISPSQLAGDTITVPGGISTTSWPPGRYKVIVYVQSGFATGEDSPNAPSAEFYAGTPSPVTNVKLENNGAGTITVKYTAPTVDIAQLASAGNYRYRIQSRAADCSWSNAGPDPVWVDLTSKPTCTGTAPSVVCSFDIASLTDGLYKVEVAGRMLYPKPSPATGNDEAIGSAVSSTTTGDHSTFMREGIIAVGNPGVPQVALTGDIGGMTIKINSITGNNNALQYRWVFLKDADTASPPPDLSTLTSAHIPFTDEPTMDGIDPLTCNPAGNIPVQSKVDLDAMRCGAGRASACEAGTYRVAVIAVNGAGSSISTLTAVDPAGSSIMGPPSKPQVSSLVVEPGTMDSLVATWQMPNTYTATSYSYRIENTLDSSEQKYDGTPTLTSFKKTVNGMGLYKVTVTATNSWTSTTSDAKPDTGLVVGLPLAGGDGLRAVSVSRNPTPDRTKKELSINFKDGLNSWAGSAGNCETFYEWEVVTSPGLQPVAFSASPIHACDDSKCSGTGTSRGCNGILADINSLPDGRYQVFVVAYNQFGFTRSAASNVVTVGTPTTQPLDVTATDGTAQIGISFPTPSATGPYRCMGTSATTSWSVVKSQADNAGTTSFTITSADAPALSTARRWMVQCERADIWGTLSAPKYAASGAPTKAPKPTLTLAPAVNGVKFTFTPADPDAAISYKFVLKKAGTTQESATVRFDSADLKDGATAGTREYTWANAPLSGSLTGVVRSVNSVNSVESDPSDAIEVGQPGKLGKPTVLSGLTGFTVSFSPGTPSTATAYYYNVYKADGTLVGTLNALKADSSTAAGSTGPTTPSGGTAYSSYTSADILTFNTGNLKTAATQLVDGFYQITVVAYNADASSTPNDLRYGAESDKSDLVALGRPGIPRSLTVEAVGWRKLRVSFDTPSPDTAAFYEYTVNNTQGVVRFSSPARLARTAVDTSVAGRVSFETQELPAAAPYTQYQLRVTAVGTGNVISNWSTPVVAGLPTKPTNVQLTAGATSLRVTFTADGLQTSTDTFAYNLYRLGATPQAAGQFLVPRTSTTGDLAASGSKYFDIALDTAAASQLKAPAGGYYVEVMPARPLTSGYEAGTASDQAGPAALGAPSALAGTPRVTAVTSGGSPKATVEWDYADQFSTYTKVDWQIKDGTTVVASGSVDRSGTITAAVSSLLSIDIPLNTGGANKDQPLAGRFTVELRMANAQDSSAWSTASAIFAAGTPTTPATVTVSGSATSLTGGFTLPANAVYTTLSYRLVSLGEDGTGTTPLFGASGWKDLTPAEIDAKTFTIPDPVVVGGTSFPVPTDRYRLEMRASANGDSSIAKSSTASAYKGTPAAATAVTATSGATSIQISFNGAAFATGYKVHVLDSNGAAVQSGGTDVISTLNGISGSGSHSYSLQPVELGSPSGAATFRFEVESLNPNTAGTGALSSATSTPVIFGKLAKPATPVLEWVAATASTTAYMELRFQAVTPPAGAEPTVYEYQLTNATSGTAIGGWQAIGMSQTTGAGSGADPYKFRLFPSPGRYTAKVRAGTALSATATSDESSASQPEVMGLTSQPSIAAIGSGDSTIVTADDGATTIKLLVTLPSNNLNSGESEPQLQLRMDTVEPTAAAGTSWDNVAASCTASTAACVESGAGTTASPLVVRVTLSAASLPTPRRVSFVARTENDNGAGAESSPSNTISVGRPGAPTVTATGSASGVEVTFTPATLLTGDTFRVWAVDASAGGSGETRLVEREVTTVTTAQGGQRTFFVPFADFEGNNIPYIVTLKMVAVNTNNKRSQDGSASASVTVGSAIAPTAVTATPALSGSTATVALSWQRGDTTVTRYDIKATSAAGAVMTFAISDGTKLGHTLTVGGGAGQLPPGRWTFTVVAYNAVSQAESDPTGEVAAGTPGVPVITGVTGTDAGTATISFAIAADNVADRVRVSYAAVGSNTWTPLGAVTIPTNNEITTAALPTGNWRFRLEAGNAGTGAWSAASSAWPATTVGLPGKPTIVSATGSKDTITLVVEQAADATATAFELEVYDADGNAVTPAYNAPLQSVSGRDGNGRQTVVFGTDNTKLGGTFRFKVAAINSLGKGTTASEMTTQAQAVAAYMPDKPTGLTATGSGDKAVLAFTPPAGAVSYEAAILVATGDTWAVTAASSLAPYAPTAVTVSGAQRQFDVPLSALANLDGRYKFQVRAVDANGVRGDWSTESGAVTVGVPDAPRNLVSTAVLDTTMADSDSSNVTLSFVPAWLAEQGYVVEVLDADGNKLDEVELAATSCTAKATAPV